MISTDNNHMIVDGEVTVHVDSSLNADDTILRYIKFQHFKSLLEDGLYIANADSFVKGKDGDPFEGEYTEQFYRVMSPLFLIDRNGKKESGDQLIKKDVSTTRSRVFANCWALSESESVAMWKLFGKEINSIAIQTSVQKLKDEIEYSVSQQCDGNLRMLKYLRKEIVRIKYIDHHNPKDREEAFRLSNLDMLCRKNFGYDYEKEVRVLFDGSEPGREAIGDSLGGSFFLKIRPEIFIDRILVSYRADDSFFDEIKESTSIFNVSDRVEWSKLKFVRGE